MKQTNQHLLTLFAIFYKSNTEGTNFRIMFICFTFVKCTCFVFAFNLCEIKKSCEKPWGDPVRLTRLYYIYKPSIIFFYLSLYLVLVLICMYTILCFNFLIAGLYFSRLVTCRFYLILFVSGKVCNFRVSVSLSLSSYYRVMYYISFSDSMLRHLFNGKFAHNCHAIPPPPTPFPSRSLSVNFFSLHDCLRIDNSVFAWCIRFRCSSSVVLILYDFVAIGCHGCVCIMRLRHFIVCVYVIGDRFVKHKKPICA